METTLPYLQLDVTEHCTSGDKQRLAKAMCETYSRVMSVDIRRITVAIRELGEGGLWRVTDVGGEPVPVSMLMLDIREGRQVELRLAVAKALCAAIVEIIGLREGSAKRRVYPAQG